MPPLELVNWNHHHFIPAPVSLVQVMLDGLVPVYQGSASPPSSLWGSPQHLLGKP